MTDTSTPTRFPHNLPYLEPIQSILPITGLDGLLAEGVDQVMLPPKDIEETSLLFHVGIRQLVYMGTHLLNWLCTHPPSGSTSLPAIMIYRHMLDLGDSIGTLLRFQGGQTNFVLLRALFESSLALNFLLQDNKFHEDRGVAYWAGYRIDQLETRLKYDPATAKGIALHALIDADPVLSLATYPRRDLKNEREELERALQSPAYKPSWEKWQEAKKKSRLFSGIPSAQRPKIFVNWPDCSGEKLNTKFSTVIYPESLTLKMCFLVSWTEPLIDPSPYIRSVDQK